MGYERYPRGSNPQGDYDSRRDPQDAGRDYGSGRDDRYGQRDYGNQRYAQREGQGGDRGGYDNRGSSGGYGGGYGGRDAGDRYGQQPQYHGSYASDGRRFEDVGRYAHADDDDRQRRGGQGGGRDRAYGNQPQGYDYQDRGFFQRAGDEVRSWFGDDDAERRRNEDARQDEQFGDRDDRHGGDRHRDSDYHSWRSGQIAAFDRDYDEFRQENRSRFENEFATWRTNRQGQRDQLTKVGEHMEVVGSDDQHVGTIDKVRGDRVLLTKNDSDAGGRHHSFPSSWIKSVDGKVTLTKTAAEAKQQWQDEERNQAMFQYGDNAGRDAQGRGDQGAGAQGESRSTGSAASSSSTANTY